MMKSMTIHTVSQPMRRMNFMRKFDHMASKIFPEESYSEQQYTTMAYYMSYMFVCSHTYMLS